MTRRSTPGEFDPYMSTAEPSDAGLSWFSPQVEPFQLIGFAWHDRDGLYRRMPVDPSHTLPTAVDDLANCTAGGQIRFQTDSRRVVLRVKLSGRADADHMTATGQCSFDCYLGEPGSLVYASTGRYDPTLIEYRSTLLELQVRETRHFTLNFPLYQGVERVEIGLERDASLSAPVPFESTRKCVVYGTSITQGGCASRPGMAYPNILSRRFPMQFLNLGFSGNGRGEPEVARIISEIADVACFILDYDANVDTNDMMRRTLPEFISILRERHVDTPILVLSRPTFALDSIDSDYRAQRDERQRIMSGIVSRSDDMVLFHAGTDLFGSDFGECTVDGIHPTDLGFQRIADALTPILARIL